MRARHRVAAVFAVLATTACGSSCDVVLVDAGFTAVLGTESYHLSTDYEVVTAGNDLIGGAGTVDFHTTRRLGFVGASYALGGATLAAEVGRLTGGRAPAMASSFGGRPTTAGHNFLAIGVRFAAGRTAGGR